MDTGAGLDETSVRELFQALLQTSPDPIMIARLDGAILHANPAACQALGRSEPEIRRLGRAGLVSRTPELERMLLERVAHARTQGEVTFVRPDGSTFPAELTSTVIPLSSGDPVTLVIFRDVSARRELERDLRESEERFRVAFHTHPDAVTITDRDTGTFVSVNAGAAVVTGWAPEEMIGRTAESLGLWRDDDRAQFVGRLRADGALRDFDTHLGRKDGSVIDVVLSARPIVVGGRDLLLTVTRDVSRQAEAERERDRVTEQFRQSQKLEAVGRLAGGVAHDFNNLLTVILASAESLRDRLSGAEPETREEIGEIQAAAERARDLTGQLLAFARRRVIAPIALDLNEVVRSSERLLRRLLGEDVELRIDVQPDLWTVSCDPIQVEQVIMNLAVNARDALPGGGRLSVETRNVELDAAGASAFPGAAMGRYVQVVVRDDGTGMPAEVLDRAFDPFFTTKSPGTGTGLGLATVHGIVRQSGGHIRLESAPGTGTAVTFLFPAIPGPPEPRRRGPTQPARGGPETILLVEDDAQVREVMARQLRAAGYRVLAARDGTEALSLLLSGEPVRLVVADVILPGISGRELATALCVRRPGIGVLYVSGYPPGAGTRDDSGEPDGDLLEKPFTASVLLQRVRAALDRSA